MASGQRLGKYTLLRKIATGGMAEVFLARSEGAAGFQKTVVIKKILPNLAEDEQFVSMFLNEARVASQLNHPNVVSIYELGEEAGSYFIAMEHIDGPNLRGLCRRAVDAGNLIRSELAVKIISLACEGLQYAHDASGPDGQPLNLIHRDISPDNILLTRQGAVKVVDFGIAKAANQPHLTKSGTLKGKLAYMPPEQIKGLGIDRRADIFALGVCLYELLAGCRPFDSTSEVAMMRAILHDPPAPLRAVRPDVDRGLESILERALQKERDQRYPSCQAFQADLDRYLVGKGMSVSARDLAALVDDLMGPPAPVQITPAPGLMSALSDVGEVSASGRQKNPLKSPPPAPALEPPPKAVGPQLTDMALSPSELRAAGSSAPRGLPAMGAVVAVVAVGLGAYFLGHRNSGPDTITVVRADPLPEVKPAPVVPAPAPLAAVVVAPPPPVEKPPEVVAHADPVEPAAHPPPHHEHGQPHHATKDPHEAPAPTPGPAALPKTGNLAFRVLPWANVEIDSRPYGQTPINEVTLEAGVHHVVLANSELKARKEMDVTVPAGSTYVLKVRLEP